MSAQSILQKAFPDRPFIVGLYLAMYLLAVDTTVKRLCMNLHFFRSLVSAMNIILGHYNLIILLELMV